MAVIMDGDKCCTGVRRMGKMPAGMMALEVTTRDPIGDVDQAYSSHRSTIFRVAIQALHVGDANLCFAFCTGRVLSFSTGLWH